MVEEGLLAAEQLEHALAEQQRTSRPLGELLVELGYVSPGAVANALAEQHGGLLKTEYGISFGLQRPTGAEPLRRRRRRPEPAAGLRVVRADGEPQPEQPPRHNLSRSSPTVAPEAPVVTVAPEPVQRPSRQTRRATASASSRPSSRCARRSSRTSSGRPPPGSARPVRSWRPRQQSARRSPRVSRSSRRARELPPDGPGPEAEAEPHDCARRTPVSTQSTSDARAHSSQRVFMSSRHSSQRCRPSR